MLLAGMEECIDRVPIHDENEEHEEDEVNEENS